MDVPTGRTRDLLALITQTITVGIYDQDDVVTLANFQVQLLRNQEVRNAVASANYTSTPLETPVAAAPTPAPATPTVETTTGPLVAEQPTSAPGLVTAAQDVDVVANLRNYVTRHGTPAARALLDKYKATRVGDIAPADPAA